MAEKSKMKKITIYRLTTTSSFVLLIIFWILILKNIIHLSFNVIWFPSLLLYISFALFLKYALFRSDNILWFAIYLTFVATFNYVSVVFIKNNAYYPMYFGSSSLDQITDVTTLTKQALKASPSGTYNISVNENEYIWWCIPNTMTINSIKSGGFEVPIEAPIVIDNYKCYRTSSRLKAGIINCIIL